MLPKKAVSYNFLPLQHLVNLIHMSQIKALGTHKTNLRFCFPHTIRYFSFKEGGYRFNSDLDVGACIF